MSCHVICVCLCICLCIRLCLCLCVCGLCHLCVLCACQALILVEYLLRNGADRFINDAKRRARDIAQLKKYKHYDQNNQDDAKEGKSTKETETETERERETHR